MELSGPKGIDDALVAGVPIEVYQVAPKSPRRKRSRPQWPEPPEPAAFHGLAGDIVRLIEPQTESDPVAILVQLLVAFGNVVGRSPHWMAEADRHGVNLMAVIVGSSAKARKGTSWGHVRRLMSNLDPEWAAKRVHGGLASGEGLINRVRDDSGESDKRFLALEPEFSTTLKIFKREGNVLSDVIRKAWDGGVLSTLSKNAPLFASDAHVSAIGHITKNELLRHLTETEQANGLGNRIIWVCAKRSKHLPEGGQVDEAELFQLSQRLVDALAFAQGTGRVDLTGTARRRWHEVYPKLSAGYPGLFGAMVARAEAQVRRLACLYALLDRAAVVDLTHLDAALALWAYSEASCRFIFGDGTGNRTADAILSALRDAPRGLTRTDISRALGNNRDKVEIDGALDSLAEHRLAVSAIETSQRGPAIERWRAT